MHLTSRPLTLGITGVALAGVVAAVAAARTARAAQTAPPGAARPGSAGAGGPAGPPRPAETPAAPPAGYGTLQPAADRTSAVEQRRVDSVPAPALAWAPCRDAAECATAKLPLDYDQPA